MQVTQLRAKRVADEAHDAIEWLNLFGPAYGLPDELVVELKSRLEHIEELAVHI